MKTIETIADLSTLLLQIELPMSIRYLGFKRTWLAEVKWSNPDYSSDYASGSGTSMIAAIVACIADLERRGAI